MNIRRKTPADSLYLLLDTLCNAFGGIILLAVLVVLLTSKEKTQTSTAADSQEMLQRRLALAQSNLQKAQQLAVKLQAKETDGQLKEQVNLLATRKELQDTIKQTRDAAKQNAKELDASGALDASERMKSLNAQLASAKDRILEASNSLAAANENTKRLKQRLADLEVQTTAKQNELQRTLRLPKEHETGKTVIYVIVRYGQIYPSRNYDLSRNEEDIIWTTTLTGETAEPVQGKGIDPQKNVAGLRSFYSNMSGSSVYLAFLVFEDSFPAFIRAKQLATESGLAYGWEPYMFSEGPVSFSSIGYRPKPQ